ncbi:MAG: hypothetical protein HY719_11490 [Planctomycetes bacterium]|nr:hypothetical protein [Planctomycetota bacterium]
MARALPVPVAAGRVASRRGTSGFGPAAALSAALLLGAAAAHATPPDAAGRESAAAAAPTLDAEPSPDAIEERARALLLQREEIAARLAGAEQRLRAARARLPWFARVSAALAPEEARDALFEVARLRDDLFRVERAESSDPAACGYVALYRRLARARASGGLSGDVGARADAVLARLDELLVAPIYRRIAALTEERDRLLDPAGRAAWIEAQGEIPPDEGADPVAAARRAAARRLDEEVSHELDTLLADFSELRRAGADEPPRVAHLSALAKKADTLVMEERAGAFHHLLGNGGHDDERWARVARAFARMKKDYPRSAYTRSAAEKYAAAARRPPPPEAVALLALALLGPLAAFGLCMFTASRRPVQGAASEILPSPAPPPPPCSGA